MNEHERLIGKTFQQYRDMGLANLFFLHAPMRIAGMHGSVPCFVQSGKAPYDLAGFYYDKGATAIGVELKETKKRDNVLSIVGEGKSGSGLQYHQLAALVDLHIAGGVAGLLWSNDGELGYAEGSVLQVAKIAYDTSVKAEKMKQTPAWGSRSIRWGHFTPVKYGHDQMPLWLPVSPLLRKKGK